MSRTDEECQNWTPEDILEQLDKYAQAYDFPMLNHVYIQNAGVCMDVFHAPDEWLIVFQELGVFQEMSFVNTVSAYGNRIAQPGTQLTFDDIMTLSSGSPLWNDGGEFSLEGSHFAVKIQGREFALTPSPGRYADAGIDLDGRPAEPIDMVRLLTHSMFAEFLIPLPELLATCGRQDAPLQRMMQLRAWHHPNIADDELPGDTDCFHALARAIYHRDPSLYTCSVEDVNTHWSNWQE